MRYLIPTLLLLALLAGLLTAFRPQGSPPPNTPNIVLIFMDDMGYGDLSCYGAMGYQTPHMDKLAMQGMRFTNFLAAQGVCTASRAALLTGCYPNRIGLWGALSPGARIGLHPDETTLADLFKTRGYATAVYGKWHLGDDPRFLPQKQGFDEFVGLPYSNDMWPVEFDGHTRATSGSSVKARYKDLPLLKGAGDTIQLIQTLDDQAKLTALYTRHAVDFIHRNRKKPFFLYVPHSMPHVPLAASARFKNTTEQGIYGDVLAEIDWSVGEILQALAKNGLDKNTIVIVTSDNGPWQQYGNHAGSTGGLREAKGNVFEGGVRVPCLVRWPGVIPAGTVCNALASTLDLLPTLARHMGASLPSGRIDGVDITPLWRGEAGAAPRKEFYYYYQKNALMAVRRGNWKLVLPHSGRTHEQSLAGKDGYPGKSIESRPFNQGLYDLNRDPGERYDVQQHYPEKVAELLQVAEAARQDLGDDLTGRPGTNRRPAGTVTPD